MKNNSNEQSNLQRSIIKDLNLTVVKAEPQVNGEDIAALIFEVDEYSDFKYRLFGWLSTSGEFFNHFTIILIFLLDLSKKKDFINLRII